jgi:hypothetical protein
MAQKNFAKAVAQAWPLGGEALVICIFDAPRRSDDFGERAKR